MRFIFDSYLCVIKIIFGRREESSHMRHRYHKLILSKSTATNPLRILSCKIHLIDLIDSWEKNLSNLYHDYERKVSRIFLLNSMTFSITYPMNPNQEVQQHQ